MIRTPVLIAGGGPVGLALALDLGWRGVACTLVEQTDGQILAPKMNEVNIRTMEFCRRWGIAEAVMNCPFPDDFPMDVVAVTKVGGYELGRIERPARARQRPGPFSPMHLQVCSQHWFDPILRERAQRFPGVQLLYRHRLESFSAAADGVTAIVTDLDAGERTMVEARFLVGCDGAGSGVRKALGVGLEGSEALSRSMHLFFRSPELLARLGVRPGTFFAAMDRDGFWGNVRAIDPGEGLWRLLFDVPRDFDPDRLDRAAWLRRAFQSAPEVEWVSANVWTRRGVVAERYSHGRVHLAGDAVHQVSPTGALGMNTGIADAVDLAWKIAAVIQGWGGERLLASYDAERRPVGARNVRMATQYYEALTRLSEPCDAIEDDTPQGEAVRRRAGAELLAQIARMFATQGLQLGYRYDESPVCLADGTSAPPDDPERYLPTARPGARAPHVKLADGRSMLDLFGHGFTLLRFGADAPDALMLERAAASRGVPLEVFTTDDANAARLYERRLVLVRPDGHVAWRADALPADPLALVDRVRGAN